jgi:UDP:flavonoid glycosyltransferase YjiC (YdhE family)
MIFVPLFGDQPPNAACAARAGAGIMLDADTLSPQSVRRATREVLAEPRYRESVQQVRAEANGLPDHAEAIRWLEHVAVHRQLPTTP